jgi:putative flavoprotein involved in K+ transport
MAQAIVCGAGAAGLASAACLKRAGLEVTVLERGDGVGASWRRRYPALRLNTLGWMSTLPGYRATRRRYGEFPTRENWIRYLEDYRRHHGLDVRLGTEVTQVDRADGGWQVETSNGAQEAPFVVVSTGFDHDPHLPDWPGRDDFAGELLHASEYRDTEPFRGRDVAVVGASVTGTEIAAFLANGGARRVRMAMRTPPNIFPRKWLGMPLNVPALLLDLLPPNAADAMGRLTQRMIYGNLAKHGLPFPPLGIRRSVDERFVGPSIDAGFVNGVKEGRIEIVPTVTGFEGPDAILADGSRIQPDAPATGAASRSWSAISVCSPIAACRAAGRRSR